MDSLTFLFTDIEGSTALWARDSEAMQAPIARHDAVVSSEIERCGGRVYKNTGDGVTTHGGIARRQGLAMELDNLLIACWRAIARAEPDTAAGCFLAAFAVLEAQGPFAVAETLGQRVAELAGLAPAQRASVLNAVSHAMFACGHPQSGNAMLLAALAAAREAKNGRAEVRALRQLAIARHHDGHPDEANGHFTAAFALCDAHDRSQRGALFANLANLQMEQGRMAEAQASYHAALDLHRETGNRAAEGIALGNLGTVHHELGQYDEARAAYEDALAIHREAGNVLQGAITLGNLGLLEHEQGNRDAAVGHYQTALPLHRELGNRRGIGVILKQMGEVLHESGDLAGAEAHYDEALAIFREIGHRRFEGGVLGCIGDALIDRRRFQAALESIEKAERLLREIDDPLTLAEVLCSRGRALVALGDAAAARAMLAEAKAIATRLGMSPDSRMQRRIGRLRDALQ